MARDRQKLERIAYTIFGSLLVGMAIFLLAQEDTKGVIVLGERLFGFTGGGQLLLAIHAATMATLAIAGISSILGKLKHGGGFPLLVIMISHTSPSATTLAMKPDVLRGEAALWLFLAPLMCLFSFGFSRMEARFKGAKQVTI
jgi:hypothetical protein